MEIKQKFNALYKPVFTTKARYIHIWGGRGRGGSYFGTDYYLHKVTQPDYFRGYFMREIFGDVRQSLWQDFKDRLDDNDTIEDKLFALREDSMTADYLPTGNKIISRGFKKSSGKQTAKMKSIAGATHILIEEAEEIDELDFYQLDDSLRTIKGEIQIIMVFNPPHKDHWIMRRWYNLVNAEKEYGPDFREYYLATPKQDPLLLSVHSTYLDNLVHINSTTAANFENYRFSNFDYYATMIKGLVSEGMKGVIFRDWMPVSAADFDALPYPSFYGLDFGYSSDPAALVEIKVHNEDVWLREVIYQRGMTNPDIAFAMECLGVPKGAEIYADCAEPKSIEELKRLGFTGITESVKGADSVNAGINWLLSKKVHYVESSTNLIFEKNNYRWALDAQKNPTNRPEDKNNHLMDATRYGTYTKYAVPQLTWLI